MGTGFLSLPLELQRQCINYLGVAALKSMRLTSHAIENIATESLFEEVALYYEPTSAEKLTSVAQDDNLRRFIRKLHLHSQYEPDECYAECFGPVDEAEDWWTQAVATAIDLPHLKELKFDLFLTCVSNACAALRTALTTVLLDANINTLQLKNFQDSCLAQRLDLQPNSQLEKLHFFVDAWSDEASPDDDIEIRHRHAFFNTHLNTSWLTPVQPQLTHLTLHCNTYWGVYPRWHPGDLCFPHLRSLAFGKWSIAFDWQLDFITSHSQTLEQLILTNCPILHALRMTNRQFHNEWHQRRPGTGRGKPPTNEFFPALRWHSVLPQFKNFPKLKYFSMGRGPSRDSMAYGRVSNDEEAFNARYTMTPCIDSSRYALFEYGSGPTMWLDPKYEASRMSKGRRFALSSWLEREADEDVKAKVDFPDCLQEDSDALEDLLGTLRRRC